MQNCVKAEAHTRPIFEPDFMAVPHLVDIKRRVLAVCLRLLGVCRVDIQEAGPPDLLRPWVPLLLAVLRNHLGDGKK